MKTSPNQHTESPSTGRRLFPEPVWQSLQSRLALSPREFEILQHVFDDDKDERIAMSLGISPHTVNTYLARLYRKLGVNSRVQLVVRVVSEAQGANDVFQMTNNPAGPD